MGTFWAATSSAGIYSPDHLGCTNIALIQVSSSLWRYLWNLPGALGGYGGKLDELIMRFMDILLAFLGCFWRWPLWRCSVQREESHRRDRHLLCPQFARITRGRAAVSANEYVLGAKAVGESDLSVIVRYVLPNALSPIIVQTTLRMATVLLTASGLGFLGLGVQPPNPEWGTMLSSARMYLRSAPHVAIFPGLAIMITVLGFNFLGDGLQDALNPRLKE